MDSYLGLQTNSSLYGPTRLSAKTDVKDLLLRDNVLQPGEWDFNSQRRIPWSTTCSNSFKKPHPILYDPQRSAKALSGQRYLTSMVFGNADNLRVGTTLKDFDRKWMKTPAKARPDLGTSIPDLASKFMSDKRFGCDGSIYANTYNDVKKVDASENAGERKQLTKDLRTTHFHLGSTKNNYGTETNHRYRPSESRETTHGPSLATLALQETYQSNVFRNGDWNVTGHPSVRYSVTRNDFHVKPFIAEAKSNEHSSLKDRLYKAMAQKYTSQGVPVSNGILQAFTQYDVTKSGYLPRDQVKAAICQFTTLIDDEMDCLIDESGALSDGKIDVAAFVNYLESSPKTKLETTTEKQGQSITGESYTGTHFMKLSYPDTSSGKPKDNPNHPYYHISTHFQLGDHSEDVRSLYYKDYMMGKKEPRSKPFPALPPMSSQVLPEPDERDILKSTKQADFNDPTEKGKALAQERDQESRKNQNRLSKQSIEISSDPKIAQSFRQSSVSGADYPSPPSEFHPLAPRRAPQSRYRFLDTNGALPGPPADPYLSEQHEKFIALNNTGYRGNKVECLDRIGDNRSSHFGFGLDRKPKGTEQHHEFSKKPPLDPSLPAAGKVQTSEQNYSHVFPSESSEKVQSHQPESTLNNVTLLQERLKEMNRMKHGIPRDPNTSDVRRAFLEFDPNMTGRVSKQDVQKVCNSLNLDIPDSTLDMLFDRCEQDKQGNIDYYQFIKHFNHQLAMTKGRKPSMASVMKTDYCPPVQRKFTPAQQRTIDLAKQMPTMASHYFHYDPSQEKTPRTITRHDFSRPDRLPGEQGLQKS